MGAAFTRFMVYTPAAAHSLSDRISARSFLEGLLPSFTPQWMPEALKP